MTGFIYIDRDFAANRELITELLSSDSFRNSEYALHVNISKNELLEKWSCIAYDSNEDDSIIVLASVLHSLNYAPTEITCDGNIDYTEISKIRANEDKKLNSIFLLNEDPGIAKTHGVAVVKSKDTSIISKQPKNRPIKNDEAVLWSSLLPYDYWNSIIIVDCYILKDKATIERNLFPILDKGRSTHSKIQVSIFTQFRKDDRKLMWDGAYDFIKSRYPKDSLEIIDVRNAPREIHDRSILTNHYYFHLPGGLDLLNAMGRSTKHTKLIAYKFPQFYEVASDDMRDFCETVKEYKENRLNIKCNKDFKNRLIY